MESPKRSVLLFTVVVMFFLQFRTTMQTVHVVGDAFGWDIPSDAPLTAVYQESRYIDWVSRNTFLVGDVLEFNFNIDEHDVAEVTPSDYAECIGSYPLFVTNQPPVRIKLTSPGSHYYLSRYISCPDPDCYIYRGPDCQNGLKLAINVSTPALSPTAPPSSQEPTSSSTTPSSSSSSSSTDAAAASSPSNNNKTPKSISHSPQRHPHPIRVPPTVTPNPTSTTNYRQSPTAPTPSATAPTSASNPTTDHDIPSHVLKCSTPSLAGIALLITFLILFMY